MKMYNCEECGFSTKYKNRIKYHINVRRKCGIENINFKRECDDNVQEIPELNKYSEIIDTINARQTKLDEKEQALKSKMETIAQRENDINNKILRMQEKLKSNEYVLALSKEQNRNIPKGFTFV
jgi:carboxypeptidase C (cathepsin A)